VGDEGTVRSHQKKGGKQVRVEKREGTAYHSGNLGKVASLGKKKEEVLPPEKKICKVWH